ncbi:MAG: OpgC domain-containing protein [Alphaproteobacteria bacterium]|nr:OpgC domain-containing protein [Alphaproteobacteria bacterium]
MDIKAIVAAHGRDARIDLFRGIANWFIFLDHIPDNVVNWITIRNYGFSGAADIFVFISGYAASIVYAKMTLERGFMVGASRIFKRAWQLYAAYVVLFVIYLVAITDAAARYAATDIIYEFNVAGMVDHPMRILIYGLLLEARPLNLDILQLYIVLVAFFPPVLWLMLRKPDLALAGSAALYFAARTFGWNIRSLPDGDWYFNPFCWQFLFVLGAWFALGGRERFRALLRSSALLYLAIAYLLFAFVITMAGRFPELGDMIPARLLDAFTPNDRENLAPYRILHLLAATLVVTRFVPRDWPGLERRVFRPLIVCGQQSLAVFCLGVFLSFAGHFALLLSWGSLLAQVLVSVSGVTIMTLAAYYISWSKLQDDPSEIRRRMASIDAHF